MPVPEGDQPAADAAPGDALAEARITTVQNERLVQQRREQICEAALELFLEKGFAATTIRDICARSGVNQASIYDYIANKNDILRRLLNQLWFREDVITLPQALADPGRPLEAAFEDYFREAWTKKRKGTLLAYRSVPHMQAEDRRAMRTRDLALIAALSERLRARGAAVDDRRVEVLANLLIFLSGFGPMRDWLMRDMPADLALRTVAAGAAAMVRDLIGDPGPEPDAPRQGRPGS